MILERYPEIQALSAEEKLLLSDELQDAAMGILEDPSTGMTPDEFQARFEEQKRAYREPRK